MALPAGTFTTLHSFHGADGALPETALVQGIDGNFYGTTIDGGRNARFGGTVFKLTPSGTLTVLYSFCSQIVNIVCTDGQGPGGLVLAADGDFYGTTYWGGTACGYPGCGTIFKISPAGKLRTLYNFCAQSVTCADGFYPYAALLQAADGDFYGTTANGGAGFHGTIFKMTPTGALATLYSFCFQNGCADGASPAGSLVQDNNGYLYGITVLGGVASSGARGTVFKITPGGALTTLYSFCSQSRCVDGAEPYAGLVQAANGEFYGTTNNYGPNGTGTVFKITPSGTLTTLYGFCSQSGCTDGADPLALVQAAHGDLYGITTGVAIGGYGTVFQITPSGKLTTLHNFCPQSGCAGGEEPLAGLLQSTNGEFYGTTRGGGNGDACPKGCGTVFRLSAGLSPFVETIPISSKVGTTVRILGTNLTGATGVTFNGAAAIFEVVSSTQVTATVPADASTGTVQVVTPSGTLSSNVAFRVRQ